jgi:hypothetical protein
MPEAARLRPVAAGGRAPWGSRPGTVQHDAYHAGQIALLKKLVEGV